MFRFVGKIAAVPVRILVLAAGMFFKVTPLSWYRLLWWLGRDSKDGVRLISVAGGQEGIDSAQREAEKMFALSNDCEIAAAMGTLEIHSAQDFSAAETWLKQARRFGVKNFESLLMLELMLTDFLPEYDKLEIIENILSRNDLPATITRTALVEKAEALIKDQQWDKADEIARRILSIEDYHMAHWVRWLTNTAKNEPETAEAELAQAKQKLPERSFLHLVALGWFYLGDRLQAMKYMRQAEKAGVKVALFPAELAALTQTPEYESMRTGG